MQDRADVIAAFAMKFGIKFSEKTFRRRAMNSLSGVNEPSTLTIRGPEWIPIEILIYLEGASNFLEGIHDLDYTDAAAKSEMVKIGTASCAANKATKASPGTKL